jgi:hypothetical protein
MSVQYHNINDLASAVSRAIAESSEDSNIGVDASQPWGARTSEEAGKGIHYFPDKQSLAYSDASKYYLIATYLAHWDMYPNLIDIEDDLQASIDALGGKGKINVPPGSFYLTNSISVPSGVHIEGIGVRRRFYYAATAQGVTENKGGTLFVVKSGVTAFKAVLRNRDQKISNMSIYAENGAKSVYGAAPGFVANTHGIDITQSEEFVVEYLDFFGLDKCIFNTTISGVQETARPRVNEVIAQDCNYLVKLVDGAADIVISNIPIALHCNYFLHFISVDGIQVSNCRFYQANVHSFFADQCDYTDLSGVTFFETADVQVKMTNCRWVSMGGMIFTRSGWYAASIQPDKCVYLYNCDNISIQGIIERPGGGALEIYDCTTVSFSGSIYNSFNGTGNATTGSINVINSKGVSLNGSIRCDFGASPWAITSDRLSKDEISGNIATNGLFNYNIAISSNRLHRKVFVSPGTAIAAGGETMLGTVRIIVPAGKELWVASYEYTSILGLQVKLDSYIFTSPSVFDEITYSNSKRSVYDNSASATAYTYIATVYLYNPTGSSITQDVGAELTMIFKAARD